MIKKIISWSAFFFLALTLAPAFASADALSATPQIYVKNIMLDKATYAAGDVVTGSFTIQNASSFDGTNIMYKVSLAGNYQPNGLAGTFYDSKIFPEGMTVTAGQGKTVSFSYTLPQTVSGSLGIQVQAMLTNGTLLGWSDALITVTATNQSPITIGLPEVMVGTTSYAAEAGPTIYQNNPETLDATIPVSNTGGTDVVITPSLEVYNRLPTGTVLAASTSQAVTIKAHSQNVIALPLPTLSYTPGVYVAEISLVDGKGITIATPEVRYIIGGDIVTIQSLVADKASVAAGDTINLSVAFTGAPADIANPGGQASVGAGDIEIKIYNENNALIADTEQSVNFDSSLSQNFAVVVNASAQAMTAEVTALKDGKVLSTYSTPLSGSYSIGEKTISVSKALWAEALIGVFTALLVLLLLWLVRHHRKLTIMVIIAVAAAFYLLIVNSTIHADSSYVAGNCYSFDSGLYHVRCEQDYIYNNGASVTPPLQTTVNTPTSPLAANEHFFFSGNLTAQACSNAPQYITYRLTYHGQRYVYTVSTDASGQGEESYNNYYQFSYGSTISTPFTAPASCTNAGTTNSNCRVQVEIDNVLIKDGTPYPQNKQFGYIDFTVTPPPPPPPATVNLVSDKAVINSGDSANLTGSSSNVQSGSCVGTNFTITGADNSSAEVAVTPTATTLYTLTCKDLNGNPVSSSTTVSVNGGGGCTGSGCGGGCVGSDCTTTTTTISSCSAAPSPAGLGKQVTWTVAVTPAGGTHVYAWSGDETGCGNSNMCYMKYTTPGTKHVSVSVDGQPITGAYACDPLNVTFTEVEK